VPQDGASWLATATRAEKLGYSTLMVADGMHLPSPFPALALAAGATTTLRVATFVAASPLRPPRLAAWDAHTLSSLSDGRFEFGIGTGVPQVVEQSVQLVGLPPTSGAERLALAAQAIDALRELDGDKHTPVLMAAGGPRARAMAAAKADIVTMAVGPLVGRDEIARLVAEVREAAGSRGDSIEFAAPVFAVGDEVPPPWIEQFLQADMAALTAHDSLMILPGTPRQMADELERRREALGISYVSVNAAYCEQFAPVVELLAGH
jgi:alkanesulfonate monooxygenase SsuD/methylene tetrahydromethanopterin reductase-like flavin-dependent oxidoreductase (luciferase family)